MRIYNVFDRYLKSIEIIRNSSCSNPFDEWPLFYYKITIVATPSFKFAMFAMYDIIITTYISLVSEMYMLKRSVILRHQSQLSIFSVVVSLCHGSTWSDSYFKDTFISRHFLQRPIISSGWFCGWFEKIWRVCLLEESCCTPTLLKVPIYSAKLVAVVFV